MVMPAHTDSSARRRRATGASHVLPDPSNRRQASRISMDVSVSFGSEHNFYAGFTENISEGGLFIASDHLLPMGTMFDLALDLPSLDATANISCEVRWIRELAYSDAENPPGMGVRFLDLAPVVSDAIGDFLRSRTPIFFPE